MYNFTKPLPFPIIRITKPIVYTKNKQKKIVDRLTYNPKKHKQKKTKAMRQKLQEHIPKTPKPTTTPTILKFGSMNVNVEASWAVQQLVSHRGFDVG